MLVKWAIEGRRKTATTKPATSEDDRQDGGSISAPPSMANFSGKDQSQSTGIGVEPETTAQALTAELDRLHFESDAAVAKSSESNGDRAMRRFHAEERDTMLRDDKLLSLTGPVLLRHNSHPALETVSSSLPLTEENIGRLAHERQDGEHAESHLATLGTNSSRANPSQSLSGSRLGQQQQQSSSRPALDPLPRESEQTVRRFDSPT